MSTDPPLPDPHEAEPYEAELAEPPPDDESIRPPRRRIAETEEVFVAELADEGEGPPSPRRRRRRPAPHEPAPPHPGFWWAVGWCLLMLLVCELFVPVGVVLVIFVFQIIRLGDLKQATNWLTDNQSDPVLLVPAQMSGHITIFLMALLALRLVVGRSWRRQIALRWPAIGHVLLALVGAPAFWLVSAGLQLIASQVLPSFNELPACFVTAILLAPVVGVYWLAVRVTTGRDWVRELSRAPLRTQVLLGPLGVLLLLVLAAQTYQLVSPYVGRLPGLNTNELEKSLKALLAVPWWAGLLIIAVTPAFSEEFWCRAFLGRGLVGRHGFVMGMIWTSFFFGAIHLFPHQAAMAAVLGLVLHSAYVASRSMLIPMLMHFLNNALAVLSYKFLAELSPRLQTVETNPEQIPVLWFVAAVFLAAAVLWAFYTSRARLVRVDGAPEPPWQPPYPSVAHPPRGSGTAVVYPWPGVWPALAVVAGVAGLACALYWA